MSIIPVELEGIDGGVAQVVEIVGLVVLVINCICVCYLYGEDKKLPRQHRVLNGCYLFLMVLCCLCGGLLAWILYYCAYSSVKRQQIIVFGNRNLPVGSYAHRGMSGGYGMDGY